MLFRLFTEDMNRDKVADIISKSFPGFTMFSADGYWEGNKEKSLVVDIIVEQEEVTTARAQVNCIANEIKSLNEQQCVLCQMIQNEHWFI